MKKEKSIALVEPGILDQKIFLIKGQKVMLDFDLAELYEVTTKHLNQQVKRNLERFPEDFMFRLSTNEVKSTMRSQIVTASKGRRNERFVPYAFTEHGVAMLSSVLHSPRAIQMNIFIIRAFTKLREMLATHADLARKIEELEKGHEENKGHLVAIAETLDSMLNEAANQKDAIGFAVEE